MAASQASQIAGPRLTRFIEDDFHLRSNDIPNMADHLTECQDKFMEVFTAEKANAPKFARAWTAAEKLFENTFDNLNAKDRKFISEELVGSLPEQLRGCPSYPAIAIVAYTMDDSSFYERFNSATQNVLLGKKDWQSYRFKSFYTLLTLAIEYLPSRPALTPKIKALFRGLHTEEVFKEDQVLSLSHFTSFTRKRRLALGRKPKCPKADAEASDDDNTDDEAQEADQLPAGVKTPNVLLRVNLGANMHALGVRHLSPFGGNEVEILVSPMQKFQVKKIKERKEEELRVVVVEPVE